MDDIDKVISEAWAAFNAFPQDVHLMCPKVCDDDDEDYEDEQATGSISVEDKASRVKSGYARLEVIYRLSLSLGFAEDEPYAAHMRTQWKSRIGEFLQSCSSCVRYWHRHRSIFLSQLGEHMDDAIVEAMQEKLEAFDETRITQGLSDAVAFIDQHDGVVEQRTFINENGVYMLVALYESLCCMWYLSQPRYRDKFNVVFERVQQRKALKLGEVLPTMTHFLFDRNHYRHRYARYGWEHLTRVTAEDFEWAVKDHLAAAIRDMSLPGKPRAQIQYFWEGFALILSVLDPGVMERGLGTLDVQPNVYQMMLNHLDIDCETNLAFILKVFYTILVKVPRSMWSYFAAYAPKALSEAILGSPAFGRLLSQTAAFAASIPEDGFLKEPVAIAWIRPFLESIPTSQKGDVCEGILHQMFERFPRESPMTQDGRITCYRGAAEALLATLTAFLSKDFRMNPSTTTIHTNRTLNLVLKYKEVLKRCARLSSTDSLSGALPETVVSTIGLALELDSRTTVAEYFAIEKGGNDSRVQQEVTRDSAGLWEAFLDLLVPGATQIANVMLLATCPLIPLDVFRQRKRIKDPLPPPKARFNGQLEKTARTIGQLMGCLADFPQTELDQLCKQAKTIKPVIAGMVHGEAGVSEAAAAVVKVLTDEVRRDDAISKLLQMHFHPALVAFTETVTAITEMIASSSNHQDAPVGNLVWSSVPKLLVCSRAFRSGLCDSGTGALRTKDLTHMDRLAVSGWWESQWAFIDQAFLKLDTWSKVILTDTMKDFCRETMEHAETLLAEDGLVSSALGSTSGMTDILKEPCNRCVGMIQMLCLRDPYLIQVAVKTLAKLLRRTVENGLKVPAIAMDMLLKLCKTNAAGDYERKSLLQDTQRAELLQVLGMGDDVEEVDDEIQTIGPGREDDEIQIVNQPEKDAFKKQSRLDAWSRSGSGQVSSTQSLARPPVAVKISTVAGKNLTVEQQRGREAIRQLKAPPIKAHKSGMMMDAAAIKASRIREREEKKARDAEEIAKARALREAPKPLVPGEGSGFQRMFGVLGIDNSLHPRRSEIMVNSSTDSSSSSEDDSDSGWPNKAGKQDVEAAKTPKKQHIGPVTLPKVQRSLKDMRARLTPPMEVLHQAILEWDIFREGEEPLEGMACSRVSDKYMDPVSYKATFFPLLLSEAWRGLITSKEDLVSKPFGVKVLTRMSVDKFLEVTAVMPQTAENAKDRLSEGDIVLLSTSARPLEGRNEPHCLARVKNRTVKNGCVEISYLLSGKAGPIVSRLVPSSELYGEKITNLTTTEREYAALESLKYYDMMYEIVTAKPSPILPYSPEAVKDVMDVYQLNESQAQAILCAKSNDAFTLIQGPPGTGKTKTIVAMVGALMTGHFTVKKTRGNPIPTPIGTLSGGASRPAKKLLVCAPSNAAVDELVSRLKEGVKSTRGVFHKINVVRLGRSDAVNRAVQDVTLDEMVKARLEASGDKPTAATSDRQKMHEDAGAIKKELLDLRAQEEAARAQEDRTREGQLARKIGELKRRQYQIGAMIDADKDSGNSAARDADIRRREMQQQILDAAQVLCATLSGSGHVMFKDLNIEFETVIIDEAAQCVELSSLIPLKYGCRKCIMVGDPQQLPPTVLSQSAQRYGFDQSLFVRMQRNHPNDVHLLSQQYRMHPEISRFPSQEFYKGKLTDGDDMAKLRHQPWHKRGLLTPYRFFDVKGTQTRGAKGKSTLNEAELQVALQLYERFTQDNPTYSSKGKIGIITPYKAQLYELRNRFSARYGQAVLDAVDFNTTDAFQGRECEIIIFSCVRANATGGIGFMTDIRRMNVGLTRAKSSLWILGDSRALQQGEFWNKLIVDAKARNLYTSGDIIQLLRGPGARRPSPTFSSAPLPQPMKAVEPMEPVTAAEPVKAVEALDVEMADAHSPAESAGEPQFAETVVIDMKDAPPVPPQPLRRTHQATYVPSSYTLHQRPRPAPSVFSNLPIGYSGLNERGEPMSTPPASFDRPVVHTGQPRLNAGQRRANNGSKRTRDATNDEDGGQPTKRAAAFSSANLTAPGSRAVNDEMTRSSYSGSNMLPPRPRASYASGSEPSQSGPDQSRGAYPGTRGGPGANMPQPGRAPAGRQGSMIPLPPRPPPKAPSVFIRRKPQDR